MAERRKQEDRTSTLVKRDGALALTFVNTSSGHRRPLGDYADLLVWGRRHGSLTSAEAGHLERLAAERPEDAAAAFGAAEDLRALLSRIMNALADGEAPPGEAVSSLSGYLVHTVPPQRIVPAEDGGFSLDWAAGREGDLGRPLWRVVLSAAAVLTTEDRGRVVRCAGRDCGLLFVARNQGSPRRWCDKKICGNRDKSLRHYHDHVKPYRQELRRHTEQTLRQEAKERARARRRASRET